MCFKLGVLVTDQPTDQPKYIQKGYQAHTNWREVDKQFINSDSLMHLPLVLTVIHVRETINYYMSSFLRSFA